MSDDKRIKEALSNASKELDSLMSEEQGIKSYLKLGLQTGTGWMVKLGYLLAFIFSALLLFTGYRFFTAPEDAEVFWGICLVLSFNAQVATKLWIFSQTNRNFLAKEIRLLELRLKSDH